MMHLLGFARQNESSFRVPALPSSTGVAMGPTGPDALVQTFLCLSLPSRPGRGHGQRFAASSDVGEDAFAGDDVTGQGEVGGRESEREPDQLRDVEDRDLVVALEFTLDARLVGV